MNTVKFFFLTIISVILFLGCTGSRESVAYPSMWYIATGTGLVPAFPDYAKSKSSATEDQVGDYAPWTEKISFTDFFIEDNKLYLFTNKAGISVFSPESESPQKEKFTDFYPFPGEISERTCGTLFTVQNSGTGEKPVFFNVYRNTIFSDNQPEANLPGIYRYFPENQTITPVFTPEDYGLPGAAQAVDVSSGENPGICFKTSTPLKVEFDYIKLENFNGESFSIKKISEGDFKSSFEQKPESELPSGIKTFLEENAYGFAGLTLMENNTKTFYTGNSIDGKDCFVYMDGEKTFVLFSDGTFFLDSGIPGKEEYSFKLPLFSEKAVYTGGIVIGDTIICLWEERDFYKVGRTGLLIARIG